MSAFWADPAPWSEEFGVLKSSSGSWAINETGGKALINAAKQLQEELAQLADDANGLSHELPLGTTPAAEVYSPFIATVASDPAQGAVTALENLRVQLEEFQREVEKAMAVYETTDQGVKQDVEHIY